MAFGRRRKAAEPPVTPDRASDAEKEPSEKVDVDIDAFARLAPDVAEKLRAQVFVPPARVAGFKGALSRLGGRPTLAIDVFDPGGLPLPRSTPADNGQSCCATSPGPRSPSASSA